MGDGLLVPGYSVSERRAQRIVFPTARPPLELRDAVFTALHDDLGHQGSDCTTSLVMQRFYWPGIDAYIKDTVHN